jgi:hypothetical protein
VEAGCINNRKGCITQEWWQEGELWPYSAGAHLLPEAEARNEREL